jgi:putative methyltransferase (TIGR04325 family)
LKTSSLKTFGKMVLPESVIRFLSGIIYGWHGDFDSWAEAKQKCTGYDSSEILVKVKSAALKVKDGYAVYERDSVLFSEIQYSYPLLSSLMWISAKNTGKLNVLDFGGSLGSTYFQNKLFLDSLPQTKWCIVEQPEFVKTGLEYFQDNKLSFFNSIEECTLKNEIHVVLLSSVLQYLEEPYKMLEQIRKTGIKYVIIDRTPFISGKNRITVQKVNPAIYKASYPCWFFNLESFLEFMGKDYKLITGFDALDRANIKSEFKGFLFELKLSN